MKEERQGTNITQRGNVRMHSLTKQQTVIKRVYSCFPGGAFNRRVNEPLQVDKDSVS